MRVLRLREPGPKQTANSLQTEGSTSGSASLTSSVTIGHHVMIAMDNTTISVLYHQAEETWSYSLLHLVVFLWLHSHDRVLWARYIPGCHNVIIDRLSRPFQLISLKWSLNLEIAALIFKLWFLPTVWTY